MAASAKRLDPLTGQLTFALLESPDQWVASFQVDCMHPDGETRVPLRMDGVVEPRSIKLNSDMQTIGTTIRLATPFDGFSGTCRAYFNIPNGTMRVTPDLDLTPLGRLYDLSWRRT